MNEEWDTYVEAVAGLSRVPKLRSERQRVITAEEGAAVQRARVELDDELHRCEQWAQSARRAVTNAEAHLVAAHVLLPSTEPEPVSGTPDELAQVLRERDEDLQLELDLLEVARKQAVRVAEAAQAKEIAAARRRKQLMYYAAAALAGLVLAILVSWI